MPVRWHHVCFKDVGPKYLGVTLDRTLSFKQHCLNTAAKIRTRNNLLSKLTATTWGANPHVMRTTALALCFSVGEYACPVWLDSAHCKKVDIALNEKCRKVTGCLRSTPIDTVYNLAGIAPANDSPEELSSTGEETRDRLQTPAVRTRTSREAAKIEVQFPTQNMRP